jgi:hypothetical protein
VTEPNVFEEQLKGEIKKWMEKLGKAVDRTKTLDRKGVDFLTNIRAYQADSLYFYNKGDLVHSFEALIWAWAYCEIGREMGILSGK